MFGQLVALVAGGQYGYRTHGSKTWVYSKKPSLLSMLLERLEDEPMRCPEWMASSAAVAVRLLHVSVIFTVCGVRGAHSMSARFSSH